jgi:hypothetical protein
MIRFGILDCLDMQSWKPPALRLADVSVEVIFCIVASVAKPPKGPNHPGWNCIGGGVHDPYHPAQGGQGAYIIGGGPHRPGIGGLTEKYGVG